jgi:hypothetical protein
MLRVKCKVDRSISLPGYAQRIWSASPNANWDAEVIALVASASIDTLSGNLIVGTQNKKVQVTNKPSSTVNKKQAILSHIHRVTDGSTHKRSR